MAEAAHAAAEQTVQEYINHHLSFLTFGKVDGHWGFAHTPEEAMGMGFWSVNVDTLGWSIFLGAAFLLFFRSVGKRATVDAPSGIQNFVEAVFEFVDARVSEGFNHKNDLIGPLCLTLFFWILLNFLGSMSENFQLSQGISEVRILLVGHVVYFLQVVSK